MLTNMQCTGFKRSSTPSTTEYIIQFAVYKPQPVRETQAYESCKISQRSSVTWQPSTLLLFCAALGMMGNPTNTWHAHVVRLTKAFQARLRWLVSIVRMQKPTAKKQRLGCILTFKNFILKLSPRALVRILTSLIILCPSFLTLMFKEFVQYVRLFQFQERRFLFDDFAIRNLSTAGSARAALQRKWPVL